LNDLKRYIADKLRSRNTYLVAALGGTFINLYGHVLVPVRGDEQGPVNRFVIELGISPGVVSLSILLAYIFLMFVGVYSSVATRFQTRGLSVAPGFLTTSPIPFSEHRLQAR
jgi:hypothetical protein